MVMVSSAGMLIVKLPSFPEVVILDRVCNTAPSIGSLVTLSTIRPVMVLCAIVQSENSNIMDVSRYVFINSSMNSYNVFSSCLISLVTNGPNSKLLSNASVKYCLAAVLSPFCFNNNPI